MKTSPVCFSRKVRIGDDGGNFQAQPEKKKQQGSLLQWLGFYSQDTSSLGDLAKSPLVLFLSDRMHIRSGGGDAVKETTFLRHLVIFRSVSHTETIKVNHCCVSHFSS